MLNVRPITLAAAFAFVSQVHRHLKAPTGAKFAISVTDVNEQVLGVAVVGRPIARLEDDGLTAEITRVATIGKENGAANACSALYSRSVRAARAIGYRHIVTFTREDEAGWSLRASGFICVGYSNGGEWDRPSRRRAAAEQPCGKFRWEAIASEGLRKGCGSLR